MIESAPKTARGQARLLPRVLAGGVLALLALSCGPGEPRHAREVRQLFGDLFVVEVWGPDPQVLGQGLAAAVARAEDLERMLSEEDPGSLLGRVNRAAGDRDVDVEPELMELLRTARDWWARTEGAYDPTVAPVEDLWGIGGDGPGRYGPALSQLESRMRLVGMDKVVLNDIRNSVRMDRAEMKLTLRGIQKGWAVDAALEALRQAGVPSARVDADDVVGVYGPPPEGEEWRVRVPHPRDPERFLTEIPLGQGAVAWTGDFQQRIFISVEQKYYPALIDPRTGKPPESAVMTVVVADRAATADVLAHAGFIMGRGEGGRRIRDVAEADAVYIDRDPENPSKLRLGITSGLQGKLEADL